VTATSNGARKAIVIGIDGAEPSIFFDLLDEGRLPFFARLATARGTTRCVQPIISPAAWGTVMTGCRPGRHRLFGFQHEVAPGVVRVSSGRERGAGSLWRYLGERERRSVVLNVPMTYPPETTPGVIVSGVDTPSMQSEFVHPPSLKAGFLGAVPDYAIDLRNFGGPSRAENRRQLARDASRASAARAHAFRWLLDTREWDLALVVFTEIDRLQHVLWVDHDARHPLHGAGGDESLGRALEDAYVDLDRLAESIVSPWLDDDPLVVVMSDHGAGTQTRKFAVASVLRAAGLLRLAAGAGYRRRLVESAVAFLRRQPLWLKDLARHAAPGMQRRGYSALLTEGIDWSRTVAYPAEFPGGIRLRADLSVAERAQALAAVRECLGSLRDPVSGGGLIGKVWEREELWPGAYMNEAPDVFFECADRDVYVELGLSNVLGEPLRPIEASDQSGGHRAEGIFLARGPGVRPHGAASVALEDFFPLLAAHLCGRYPENLDGTLRSDLFDMAATPEVWHAAETDADDFAEAEESQVRDRLEGLGYL
jgi:predicted AlkP superfamily phosphohydrolase/phosphomutase